MPKIIITTDDGVEMETINVTPENLKSPLGKAAIWFEIVDAVDNADSYGNQFNHPLED